MIDYCINANIGGSQTCKHYCGSPSGESNYRDCSCDSSCYFYNDCCPDYEISCVAGWAASEVSTSLATDLFTTTTENTTEEQSSTTQQLWYVLAVNNFYDKMDLFRTHIPDNVRDRPINTQLNETCFVPSIGPEFAYFMISNCPDDSSAYEQDQCSTYTWTLADSLVPVYSNSSGLFYANKFCAACHGHTNQSQLEFMTLSCEWTCSELLSPYLEDAPQTIEDCEKADCFSLKWLYNNKPPRRCRPVITNCPLNNTDPISNACHSYSAYVFAGEESDEKMYKNVHCAFCNKINKTRNECSGTFNTESETEIIIHGSGDQVPLTVLFDFTGGTLHKTESFGGPPPPLDCPEHFLYDREAHECRRVSCPPGAVLLDNQCSVDKDQSQIENRTLSSNLDPTYRRIIFELATNDDSVTDEQILEFLYRFWYIYQHIEFYSIRKSNMSEEVNEEGTRIHWDGKMWVKSNYADQEEGCLDEYHVKYTVTLEGKVASKVDNGIISVQNWLERRSSCNPKFSLDFALIRVSFFNFPDAVQLCTNNSSYQVPKAYGERSFARSHNDSENAFHIDIYSPNGKTETYNSDEVAQEVVFTGGQMFLNNGEKFGNWSRTDWSYFCEKGPLCPLITLSKEEYQWQFGSDHKASLVLLTSGREVPDDEIVLSYDGLVQICLIFDSFYMYAYSSGQTLATTIGCVVSLTLLALVIITYCTFSSLRNVPGKTVLNLSISLFLAQLLLLVGAGQTENWKVCLTISCILHFMWLSVFSWTNILAFDLAKTFGKKSSGIRSDDNSNTRFIKYSLYAWGIPLVVVGITTILHFFQEVDGKLRNIYGLATACWLRSGPSLLIAFGVPVAIALVIDIVYFVYTVLGIRATMKMAKILKEGKEGCDDIEVLKKELNLYVRVSC